MGRSTYIIDRKRKREQARERDAGTKHTKQHASISITTSVNKIAKHKFVIDLNPVRVSFDEMMHDDKNNNDDDYYYNNNIPNNILMMLLFNKDDDTIVMMICWTCLALLIVYITSSIIMKIIKLILWICLFYLIIIRLIISSSASDTTTLNADVIVVVVAQFQNFLEQWLTPLMLNLKTNLMMILQQWMMSYTSNNTFVCVVDFLSNIYTSCVDSIQDVLMKIGGIRR